MSLNSFQLFETGFFSQKLSLEREEQCKDHKMYKDATESLQIWLSHSKEKVPSMKERSLSDKLAIENVLVPLETILNTRAQGEALLEHVLNGSQIVLPNTSKEGRKLIHDEIAKLTHGFQSFFTGKCANGEVLFLQTDFLTMCARIP